MTRASLDSAPERWRVVRATTKFRGHGVSVDWFREKFAEGCGLCGLPFESEKRALIDHDHDCCPGDLGCSDCVRGLVHPACNGMIHDIKTVASAGRYLIGQPVALVPAPDMYADEDGSLGFVDHVKEEKDGMAEG